MQENTFHKVRHNCNRFNMSLQRIILTVIVVTYGTNASFWFDKLTNKYSVSPDDDDISDSLGLSEEFGGDGYDTEDINTLYLDYPEPDYEHESEIVGRQLPESGEAKTKKSQTWCKIKKVTKYHHESGYEFFPKSYSEYDCVPHLKHDASSDNAIYSNDVCPVHHGHCVAMQKKYYFMKRKVTEKCWKLDVRAVKVGCKCIPPSPL